MLEAPIGKELFEGAAGNARECIAGSYYERLDVFAFDHRKAFATEALAVFGRVEFPTELGVPTCRAAQGRESRRQSFDERHVIWPPRVRKSKRWSADRRELSR